MVKAEQDVLDPEPQVARATSPVPALALITKEGRVGVRRSVCVVPARSWTRTSTSVTVADSPSTAIACPAKPPGKSDRAPFDMGAAGEDPTWRHDVLRVLRQVEDKPEPKFLAERRNLEQHVVRVQCRLP
jgi:hypothetical protein